jgi:hypothetical protein
MNVTRALPLKTIKKEAGGPSKAREKKEQLELISIKTTHHAPPFTRDLGSTPFLESL